MKVFTVHEPPESDRPTARFDRVAFVNEGFCWPALFIPFIWILWHRMWWVVLGWFAVAVLTTVLAELVPATDTAVGIFSVLFTLWFALEANGLRRWSLERKGWRMLGVAAGRDVGEAERSFFARHLGAAVPVAAPYQSPAQAPSRFPAMRPATPGGVPVIGLFPRAD